LLTSAGDCPVHWTVQEGNLLSLQKGVRENKFHIYIHIKYTHIPSPLEYLIFH